MVKESFAPFDAADYLDSEEMIAGYLTVCAEDPDPEIFISALGDVARARSMAQIAKSTGMGRESLYKALRTGSKPRFETVNAVLHALGVKMTFTAGTSTS